LTSSK
jgi:hypothetical protein